MPSFADVSHLWLPALGLWLVLINLWAFWAFWLDKRRALAGDWRLPEALLLQSALLGGSPGAKLAQHLFRHKTRKEPFRSHLNSIVQGQVVLLLVALLAVAILVALQVPPGLAPGGVADPAASAADNAPRQSPVPPRNPRG
jgi:uncharacterized membrane protein YsdA (DUF1294 family)